MNHFEKISSSTESKPPLDLTCKFKFLVIISDENKANLQNAKCGVPASIHQLPGVMVEKGAAVAAAPSEEKSLTLCTPLHEQGSKCSLRLQLLQS